MLREREREGEVTEGGSHAESAGWSHAGGKERVSCWRDRERWEVPC